MEKGAIEEDGNSVGVHIKKTVDVLLQITGTTADKCRLCRDYRPCGSCGKGEYFGEEKIAKGEALICYDCQQWQEQERTIGLLTLEELAKIEAEAKVLVEASSVRETRSFAEELQKKYEADESDKRIRDLAVRIWELNKKGTDWKGVDWLYETPEATYVSSYPVELLQELATIFQLDMKSRTQFLSCILGDEARGRLYYFLQWKKEGKEDFIKTKPYLKEKDISELKARLEKSYPVLAEFFCSFEQTRQETAEKISELKKELEDFGQKPEFSKELEEVKKLLKDAESSFRYLEEGNPHTFDYSPTLQKAQEGLEKLAILEEPENSSEVADFQPSELETAELEKSEAVEIQEEKKEATFGEQLRALQEKFNTRRR